MRTHDHERMMRSWWKFLPDNATAKPIYSTISMIYSHISFLNLVNLTPINIGKLGLILFRHWDETLVQFIYFLSQKCLLLTNREISLEIPNKTTLNFKNYIDNPVQIIQNMYENDINVMKSHLNTK